MSMDIDEPFKPQDEKMIEDIINAHQPLNVEENSNDVMPDENLMVNEPEQIKGVNPPKYSHKKEKNNLIRLPLSKIKNTMKLDSEIKLCQKNAYFVIGKLTELFLQEIAKNAHIVCKNGKRKTINLDDINTSIKRNEKFSFIDMNSLFYVDSIEKSKPKQKEGKKKETKKQKTPNKGKKQIDSSNNMKIDNMFLKKE